MFRNDIINLFASYDFVSYGGFFLPIFLILTFFYWNMLYKPLWNFGYIEGHLYPRATSQADMLACPFGDCRESQMPRHLREYLACRLQNNEMWGNWHMSEKRCYTVKELQEILGVSRPTIYNLLKKNEFRWIQLDGGKYRISKKSFDDWLDKLPESSN